MVSPAARREAVRYMQGEYEEPDVDLNACLDELAAMHPRWGKRRKRKEVFRARREPMAPPNKPNERWSMDFMSYQLANGRTFRTLNIIDEFTRECLAIEVYFSLGGMRVGRVLDKVVEERGYPSSIVVDNGPEFASLSLVQRAYKHDVKIAFIQPGKPQ